MAQLDWSAVGKQRRENSGIDDLSQRFPEIFNKPKGFASGEGSQESTDETPGASNATPSQPGSQPTTAVHEYRPATGNLTDEQLANEDWGQYLKESAQNIPGSAINLGKGVIESLSHPVALVGNLAQLGSGAISKGAGYLGYQQDQGEKAKKEKSLDAVIESYKNQYGDWNKIRRTVHDNPAAPLLDIASIAPGIGQVGKIAGLGEKAAAASRLVSLADPVQLGLAAAKKFVGRPAESIGKTALEFTSNVPVSAMDDLQKIGMRKYKTPAEASAAIDAYKNRADAEGVGQTLRDSVDQLHEDASNNYAAKNAALVSTPVSTAPIINTIDDIINTQLKGHAIGSKLVDPAYKSLMRMRKRLSGTPNMTPQELNVIKKDFDLIVQNSRGKTKYLGALGEVPRSVIDTIGSVDKNYADMLSEYGDFKNLINELSQNFGNASKASDATILKKISKAARTPNGRNLMKELQNTDAGKYLPEQLAGYFTKEWTLGWGTSVKDLIAAGLIYGSGAGLTPAALAGAAMGSSKIVGSAMKMLGRTKRVAGKVGTLTGPTARNLITQAGVAGQAAPLEGAQQAAGGRVERKAGGRVGNPGDAAERLILAAERAKKSQGNATSALLQMPDEAITKALAVANEHI